MTITVYGKPVTITAETIRITREWFAQNALDCIEGAIHGKYRVNDLNSYIEWQHRRMAQSLAGEWDCNLTFVQRALFIQTGESVPLLS